METRATAANEHSKATAHGQATHGNRIVCSSALVCVAASAYVIAAPAPARSCFSLATVILAVLTLSRRFHSSLRGRRGGVKGNSNSYGHNPLFLLEFDRNSISHAHRFTKIAHALVCTFAFFPAACLRPAAACPTRGQWRGESQRRGSLHTRETQRTITCNHADKLNFLSPHAHR